ncbi:MAG: hypothetical protein ACI4J6_00110 [Oscillospiraceae bacterium]
MLEPIKKFDNSFTLKRKGFFALGAVVLAALWAVLWLIFPMEWYAVFFASTVGSYVTLALLAAVLILPFCWLFSLITSTNISVTKNFIVNFIFLVGTFFLFAAFRYSMVWLMIIAAVLHIGAMVWVLGTASVVPKKRIKRMKAKPVFYEKITGGKVKADEDSGDDLLPIKKQPIAVVLMAVLYVVLIDLAYILLAWQIAFTFNG